MYHGKVKGRTGRSDILIPVTIEAKILKRTKTIYFLCAVMLLYSKALTDCAEKNILKIPGSFRLNLTEEEALENSRFLS